VSARTESDRKQAASTARVVDHRDLVPTVAATLAAIGVAVFCWSVLGWHRVVGVALVTFATFVVALTIAEWLQSDDPEEVDLSKAEREEHNESEDDAPELEEAPALAAVADVGAPEPPDRPTKHRTITGTDVVEFFVAVVAGLAVAELVRIVIDMQSIVGFVLWWYVALLATYFLLVRDRRDAEAALDQVVTVLVWSVAALVVSVLVWMIVFIFARGIPKLAWSFFTEDLSKVGPLNPGGGARHAIIGTLEQVAIATVIVVPIAILTAIYLNEVGGRLGKPVRFIVDAMSGLPSIVAGLLVFTVMVPHWGFSGLAGAFALSILMLPTVTRASEEILRTVPDSLREGALALGSPEWRLAQRVVLPTAIAGLVTAAILGVARAIGETAPMLLTAFGADTTNTSPVHGPQDDLPLFVYKLIRSPEDIQVQRAFTGAVILVMLIFVLFVIARLVASRGQRRLGRVR